MVKYQSFDLFEKDVHRYLQQIILKATDYCNKFNLEFYIDEDFDFNVNDYYKNAIACYESGSALYNNEIQIALSLEHLFEIYSSRDVEIYNLELLGDLIVTIFHEIGHGLIEYFCAEDKFPDDGDIKIPQIIIDDKYDEEEIVEQFGLSFAPQYTHINSYDSELRQAFEFIAEQIEEQQV